MDKDEAHLELPRDPTVIYNFPVPLVGPDMSSKSKAVQFLVETATYYKWEWLTHLGKGEVRGYFEKEIAELDLVDRTTLYNIIGRFPANYFQLNLFDDDIFDFRILTDDLHGFFKARKDVPPILGLGLIRELKKSETIDCLTYLAAVPTVLFAGLTVGEAVAHSAEGLFLAMASQMLILPGVITTCANWHLKIKENSESDMTDSSGLFDSSFQFPGKRVDSKKISSIIFNILLGNTLEEFTSHIDFSLSLSNAKNVKQIQILFRDLKVIEALSEPFNKDFLKALKARISNLIFEILLPNGVKEQKPELFEIRVKEINSLLKEFDRQFRVPTPALEQTASYPPI